MLAFHNITINVCLVIIKDTVYGYESELEFTFIYPVVLQQLQDLVWFSPWNIQFSKPTSWPSSMQKSKTLRYRGAAQIINSFISFSQENAPQLFQYL